MSALVDPDVVARVLRTALLGGGSFAELFASDEHCVAAELDSGITEVTTGHDQGAGIRVVVGATTGFAHTADVSEAGLLAAARAAAEIAAWGRSRTAATGMVDPARLTGAGLLAGGELSPRAGRTDLLAVADDAARSVSGAMNQVLARGFDQNRRILIANSDGLLVTDEQNRSVFSVACLAANGDDTASGDRGLGRAADEPLSEDDVAELARRAARQAVGKLGGHPAPSAALPVVFGGGAGGVLLHEACGHGLEYDLVARHGSVFAGRRGTRVASRLLTFVDDATLPGGWGSSAVDDEGQPAARTVLISEGMLIDYLYDRTRARAGGRTRSGNGRRESYQHLPLVRMTNVIAQPGDTAPEDIIADTAQGVYVTQLDAGEVDPATGEFVFGITEAYLIEQGEVTRPLREGSVIGQSLDVLDRIDAIGRDLGEGAPATCDKDAQRVPVGDAVPTLRVAGMTISAAVQ